MIRFILIALFGFVQIQVLFAQGAELSVQRGHSNAINLISYAPSGEMLASYGEDKQLVLWDVRKGKEMKTIPINDGNVDKIGFTSDNKYVYLKLGNKYIYYNIADSKFEIPATVNAIERDKQHFVSTLHNYEVVIKRAKLIKQSITVKKKIFKKAPDYFDEYYTSVDVSELNNLIVAGNADGKVYVYNLKNGKKVADQEGVKHRTLKGHISNINDICFSPDQNYFATASSDRSIIIWSTKSLKIVKRLYTQSFRNYSIAFSEDGNKIALGNEIGQVKLIDLSSTNLALINYQVHLHPVSKIIFDGNERIITSGHDNKIKITSLKNGKTIFESKYQKGITKDNIVNGFFQNVMKYYRKPYSLISTFDKSNNGERLVYSGVSIPKGYPVIRLVDLKQHSNRRIVKNESEIKSLKFINDSSFVSCDAKDSISYWVISGKNISVNTITLPVNIEALDILDAHNILLINADFFYIFDILKNVITAEYPLSHSAYSYNSKLKRLLVADHRNDIYLFDLSRLTFQNEAVFKGHSDEVRSIAFHPNRSIFASTGFDASLKLWDLNTGQLIVSIVPIGKDDRIGLTVENYYLISKKNLNSVGFKVGQSFFLAEQFDMAFNRPDIVLERLGFIGQETLDIYKNAHEKRLNRMNYISNGGDKNLSVPVLTIVNKESIPFITKNNLVNIQIKASDAKTTLKSLSVFVNNIPVYGTNGIDLTGKRTLILDTGINLFLSPGINKVAISCLNEQGVESYRESFETEFIGSPVKSNIYFIGIGVSNYKDTAYNLKYAVKDVRDLAAGIKVKYPEAKIFLLTDSNATRANILKLKEELMKTSINDRVIISLSGHGLLGHKLDFYYATYDIDFHSPDKNGLLYDELESLLDGIPTRNKLLLVDACHSGEVDKTSGIRVAESTPPPPGKGVNAIAAKGAELLIDSNSMGLQNSFELMKEIFADISNGNGAVVISAAGGMEYALESNQWNNGVFTYSVLQALKENKADADKNGSTSISELKNYVSEHVQKLTGGRQKPTSRRENLDTDWTLW
jgi:WD40 repeat protein